MQRSHAVLHFMRKNLHAIKLYIGPRGCDTSLPLVVIWHPRYFGIAVPLRMILQSRKVKWLLLYYLYYYEREKYEYI